MALPQAAASLALDPRLAAFRPDLADSALRGRVPAERYVKPQIARVAVDASPLYHAPGDPYPKSQLRAGEFVDVFDRADGFAWVQNQSDRYVGYVPESGLADTIVNLSARIAVRVAPIYQSLDPMAGLQGVLTLGCRVAVEGNAAQGMVPLATGGYMAVAHLTALDDVDRDYVFTAGRLLGVPYCHGGRTAHGVDGAGLVQLSLELAGIECPRDVDLQAAVFGTHAPHDMADYPFRRGDLVFFQDHVGMMVDVTHVIHADPLTRLVGVEPLADMLARGHILMALGAAERVKRGQDQTRG